MSLKLKIVIIILGFFVALGTTYFFYSRYAQQSDEAEEAKIINNIGEVDRPEATTRQTSYDPDFSDQEPKEYKGEVVCVRQYKGECVRGLKTWTGKVYELTRFELRAGERIQEGDKLTVTGYTFKAEEDEDTVIYVLEYEK